MSEVTASLTGLLCQRCGFSLGGLTLQERCPRCELTVEQSIAGGGWQPALDEHGAIWGDLPCYRCEYNLKGLNENGTCPECGLAIVRTARGQFLCFSERGWVARIALGSRIVTSVIILLGLIVMAGWLAPVWPAFQDALFTMPGWFLAVLAATVLGFAGVWLITAPEHDGLGYGRWRCSRIVARIGLAIGLCGPLVAIRLGAGLWWPLGRATGAALMLVSGIAWLLWSVAYLGYVQHLCARIPDRGLMQSAGRLKLGVPLSVCTIVACAVVVTLVDQLVGGFGAPLFAGGGLISIVAAVVLLSLLVVALVFHLRFSRAMHREAESARINSSAMSQ